MPVPRTLPRALGSTLLVGVLAACVGDEPVVSGVKPRTVEEVRAKRESQAIAASPRALEVGYTKADGVYIDVRFLGGRSYTAIRPEIEAQLGGLLETNELPEGQGVELAFTRGRIRTLDGTIYMLDIPLPEPMRRDEALRLLGFPEIVPREYNVLALEYRLTNVWDFRRLRFFRTEPDGERVDRVEAWKRTPTRE